MIIKTTTTTQQLDESQFEILLEKVVMKCLNQKFKDDQDKLLSIRETAALLGRSRATIYNMLKSAKYKDHFPKPKRIAGSLYFSKNEILQISTIK